MDLFDEIREHQSLRVYEAFGTQTPEDVEAIVTHETEEEVKALSQWQKESGDRGYLPNMIPNKLLVPTVRYLMKLYSQAAGNAGIWLSRYMSGQARGNESTVLNVNRFLTQHGVDVSGFKFGRHDFKPGRKGVYEAFGKMTPEDVDAIKQEELRIAHAKAAEKHRFQQNWKKRMDDFFSDSNGLDKIDFEDGSGKVYFPINNGLITVFFSDGQINDTEVEISLDECIRMYLDDDEDELNKEWQAYQEKPEFDGKDENAVFQLWLAEKGFRREASGHTMNSDSQVDMDFGYDMFVDGRRAAYIRISDARGNMNGIYGGDVEAFFSATYVDDPIRELPYHWSEEQLNDDLAKWFLWKGQEMTGYTKEELVYMVQTISNRYSAEELSAMSEEQLREVYVQEKTSTEDASQLHMNLEKKMRK